MTRPLTLALGASLLGATLLAGCATTAKTGGAGDDAQARAAGDPYPSTYAPIASPPVLISGATVLTGTGTRLDGADVLLQDGKVAAIGTGLTAPAGAVRVDGSGKRSEEHTSELQSLTRNSYAGLRLEKKK